MIAILNAEAIYYCNVIVNMFIASKNCALHIVTHSDKEEVYVGPNGVYIGSHNNGLKPTLTLL